jgi:hypothetical protein
MSLVTQLANKLSYTLHAATYDPEAEKYAKEQKAKAEADAAALEEAKKTNDAAAIAAAQKKKDDADAAAKAASEKERESFDASRLVGRVFGTVFQIVGIFLLIFACLYGASLATNLNVYRDLPFRILYAVYGFLFFWIVIPYVLLYRWWWKGLRPRFYAVFPFIPYHFDNYYAAMFLSWMSYKPDDVVHALEEWKKS